MHREAKTDLMSKRAILVVGSFVTRYFGIFLDDDFSKPHDLVVVKKNLIDKRRGECGRMGNEDYSGFNRAQARPTLGILIILLVSTNN